MKILHIKRFNGAGGTEDLMAARITAMECIIPKLWFQFLTFPDVFYHTLHSGIPVLRTSNRNSILLWGEGSG